MSEPSAPVIHTSKGLSVRLVDFVDRHLTPKYVSWLNNPEVVRYSEQRHIDHSIESCKQYVEGVKSRGDRIWAVEVWRSEKWDHVGNVGLTIDKYNRTGDLAIMIGEKSVWGHGVGLAAWTLALRMCFSDICLRIVTAGTMAVNKPMRRLFEKSGMVHCGTIPQRFIWEGQFVDMILVSAFAADRR